MCDMTDLLEHSEKWECVTGGHEWEKAAELEKARVVMDAHGNLLTVGDCVILIKDLPLKGGSSALKGGPKSKPIRLVNGDHEISCKIDGAASGLRACFVRKA